MTSRYSQRYVQFMKAQSGSARILLIDDDIDLTEMLTEYLEAEGFGVEAVFNGRDGVARALSGEFDAVILDVMMPQVNGIDALRHIRQTSNIPVIMLTAKGDHVDRVVGLELGADDYVGKPYYPRELLARLRALLRRNTPVDPIPEAKESFEFGLLLVDVPRREVTWQGQPVLLTLSEFNILIALLKSGETVATKDELSLKVLGRPRQMYDRSIDVHISNLRQKLQDVAGKAIEIETVRGVGYRLVTTS